MIQETLAILESPPWMKNAACATGDFPLSWWYPEGDDAADETTAGIQICESCPVRVQCLIHSFEHPRDEGEWGTWGGKTQWQRTHVRKRMRWQERLDRRHS
jgi:WhiB family transcriptional regulator, redox-sensing transcriptional regulator